VYVAATALQLRDGDRGRLEALMRSPSVHLGRALDFITSCSAKNLGRQPDVLCSVHNGKTVFTRKPAAYMTTMDGFAAS